MGAGRGLAGGTSAGTRTTRAAEGAGTVGAVVATAGATEGEFCFWFSERRGNGGDGVKEEEERDFFRSLYHILSSTHKHKYNSGGYGGGGGGGYGG